MRGDDEGEHIDMRPLLRLGAWGLCAVLALGSAVFAGRTEIGERRAAAALVALRTAPAELLARAPVQLAAQPSEAETRRLSEAVRTLTADRDRLAGRVATLERNLTDLTGSVSKPSAERAPASGPPPTVASTPAAPAQPNETRPAAAEAPAVAAPASVPAARPAPSAVVQSYVRSTLNDPPPAETRVAAAPAAAPTDSARTEFGIELAMSASPNTLRSRWAAIRAKHPAQLAGLEPVVSARNSVTRPGMVELHLVAGPLPDAVSATRLCAALNAAGTRCQRAAFDGQPLAQR